MGSIPLTIENRLPEEARLIALCLYAGIIMSPDVNDKELANIYFKVGEGTFHNALLNLVERVPLTMATNLKSYCGQEYVDELLRCLTETLWLAKFSPDDMFIRLEMTEKIGYELIDHLGITDKETFEYVRELGKDLVDTLTQCKVRESNTS